MKWLWLILLMSCGRNGGHSTAPLRTPAPPEVTPVRCESGSLPKGHVRAEDFLSFPNFGYRGVGRCRGHAVLTQKLLFLLRFKPQAPWDCADITSCKALVRTWLEQVDEGNVVTVPGFANLAEFSAHPWVEPILRGRIIAYGSSYQAVRLPLPGSAPRSVNVFHEALRRVRAEQVPYVALLGPQVGNHGVLAYAVQGHKLCVRDPNIPPAQGREECDNFMFVEGETVRYVRIARPEDIVSLEMTDDEDKRVAIYRRTLCR